MFDASIERGTLRSGHRFAARNKPFYTSFNELKAHHSRLFHPTPAVTSEVLRIGDGRHGNLLQTTIRFRIDSKVILQTLRNVFLELFREHHENAKDGFEIVTVFNAVLSDANRTSFSVFYGHDYAYENASGGASELKYSEEPVTVRSLLDVKNIPITFDFEQLLQARRFAFDDSGVTIERFINIVYLIRRLITLDSGSAEKRIVRKHHGAVELDTQLPPTRTFEGQKNFFV